MLKRQRVQCFFHGNSHNYANIETKLVSLFAAKPVTTKKLMFKKLTQNETKTNKDRFSDITHFSKEEQKNRKSKKLCFYNSD